MAENNCALVSFPSTHHAIAGEKLAKTNDIENARLIPLPPQISAGCGLVLKIDAEELENVLTILSKGNILYEDVFLVQEKENVKTYTKQDIKK